MKWTPRFESLTTYTLLESIDIKVGRFVSDVALGIKPELKPGGDWLGAVRISVPPYPTDMTGIVCDITARHRNPKGLEKELYAKIRKLNIPDMQYRSDAVSGVQNRIKKLKDWRYL